MEGRATLTMETSSTTMNWATQAMDRMIQSGTFRPLRGAEGFVVGLNGLGHRCVRLNGEWPWNRSDPPHTLWTPFRPQVTMGVIVPHQHAPGAATTVTDMRRSGRGGSHGNH